jgi:predicted phosphoadenosine phosphosulfate sulfurtransferase
MDQAVLVWNLALVPKSEQDQYWRQITEQLGKGLPPHVAPEYLKELRAWLRWRKSHYGDDRRAISNYDLKWANGEPRLRVFFTQSAENKKSG